MKNSYFDTTTGTWLPSEDNEKDFEFEVFFKATIKVAADNIDQAIEYISAASSEELATQCEDFEIEDWQTK